MGLFFEGALWLLARGARGQRGQQQPPVGSETNEDSEATCLARDDGAARGRSLGGWREGATHGHRDSLNVHIWFRHSLAQMASVAPQCSEAKGPQLLPWLPGQASISWHLVLLSPCHLCPGHQVFSPLSGCTLLLPCAGPWHIAFLCPPNHYQPCPGSVPPCLPLIISPVQAQSLPACLLRVSLSSSLLAGAHCSY